MRAKAIEAVCLVSLLGRAPHTHAHNFSYPPFVKGKKKKKKKSPNEQINKKNKANKKSQISKNEHATAQRNAKISSPSFYSTVDSHSTHQENYIKTTTTTTEGRQDLLYNPAGFCTLTFISDIYFGTRVVGLGETSLDTS